MTLLPHVAFEVGIHTGKRGWHRLLLLGPICFQPGQHAIQIANHWIVCMRGTLTLQPQGLQASLMGSQGISLQVIADVQGAFWRHSDCHECVLENGTVRLFPAYERGNTHVLHVSHQPHALQQLQESDIPIRNHPHHIALLAQRLQNLQAFWEQAPHRGLLKEQVQLLKKIVKTLWNRQLAKSSVDQCMPETASIWLPNPVAYGIVTGQRLHWPPGLSKGTLHSLSRGLDTVAS